jgi:hypothetical protein
MTRKANGRGKIRSDLEGIALALVDVEEVAPFICQRIEQAIRRAGMKDLLLPALEDIRRIARDVADAKSLINTVTVKLMERK